MAKSKLRKKQRKLVAELRYLLSILALDPTAIIASDDPEAWTTRFELAKDQIIRSAIIVKYVLIDEFLSMAICWQYFRKKRSFQQLWRTKRFQSLNCLVLEKLYLLQKLDLVRAFHTLEIIPRRHKKWKEWKK